MLKNLSNKDRNEFLKVSKRDLLSLQTELQDLQIKAQRAKSRGLRFRQNVKDAQNLGESKKEERCQKIADKAQKIYMELQPEIEKLSKFIKIIEHGEAFSKRANASKTLKQYSKKWHDLNGKKQDVVAARTQAKSEEDFEKEDKLDRELFQISRKMLAIEYRKKAKELFYRKSVALDFGDLDEANRLEPEIKMKSLNAEKLETRLKAEDILEDMKFQIGRAKNQGNETQVNALQLHVTYIRECEGKVCGGSTDVRPLKELKKAISAAKECIENKTSSTSLLVSEDEYNRSNAFGF